MKGNILLNIIGEYRKCPICGERRKYDHVKFRVEKEIITFECICGWSKKIDVKKVKFNKGKKE